MKRNTVNKASDFIMSSGVSFAAALFFSYWVYQRVLSPKL
jgi:hypothetical protein